MRALGPLHLAAACLALASGGWVVLRRKGTAGHRRAGWVYAAAMVALNGTALGIYRLTGGVGPFHLAAFASLVTLAAGMLPALRRPRRPGWLERHYVFMSWSYVGLVAAAVAETATRATVVRVALGGPSPRFWTTVAVASAAVIGAGSWIIRRRRRPTLSAIGHGTPPLAGGSAG